MTSTGESISALARRIEEYLREQPRSFLEAMTLTDEEVAGRRSRGCPKSQISPGGRRCD